MVFNSLQFVWFFLAVYALYRACPPVFGVERGLRAQNWLLLVASYYFYAAWDYRFVALLAASTIVDYTCGNILGRLQDQRRRRLVLIAEHRLQSEPARILQVFQFLRGEPRGVVRRRRVAARLRHAAGASADRDLVLHVRHDELRHRCLPSRNPADAQLRRLRGIRRVLPPPGGWADPARDNAPAADRAATADPDGPDHVRSVADRVGVLPEDLRRRQPRAARLAHLRARCAPGWHQRVARRLRVRVPDLR